MPGLSWAGGLVLIIPPLPSFPQGCSGLSSPYPMERAEQETIIIVNQADTRAGFFTFGTSYESHWQRLLKRVGGIEKLSGVRVSKSVTGRVTWRQANVPIIYLHPGLAIKTEKSIARVTILPRGKRFKKES